MRGKPLMSVLAVLAALLALWLAPSASASQALAGNAGAPTGPYAPFAECPLNVPTVYNCLLSTVTGGQVSFGAVTVPIDRPLTLEGGLSREETGSEVATLVPETDGETLLPTPLEVPGGLLHLLGASGPRQPWEQALAHSRALNAVTATLELVGTAQYISFNLEIGEGPGLILPVRIRLRNPLLGDRCYVGSVAEPITLSLTDGTTSPPPPNQPITGSFGSATLEQEGGIIKIIGSTNVDNAFATPGVNGCGPSGSLDQPLDHGIGLPSPAGSNTAIIEADVTLAAAGAVRHSEQ